MRNCNRRNIKNQTREEELFSSAPLDRITSSSWAAEDLRCLLALANCCKWLTDVGFVFSMIILSTQLFQTIQLWHLNQNRNLFRQPSHYFVSSNNLSITAKTKTNNSPRQSSWKTTRIIFENWFYFSKFQKKMFHSKLNIFFLKLTFLSRIEKNLDFCNSRSTTDWKSTQQLLMV